MHVASPLISVDELSERLSEVCVLDVRYRMGGPPGAGEYAVGHIPGASYVDLDTALAAAPGPRGRHPLPEVDVFQAAMRAAGVSGDRPVVVYDDWQGRAAARCWWLLRWAGHPDVRVLDGGWAAWVEAGGVVSTSLDHQETSLDHQETSLDHQETSLDRQETSLDHQETSLDHQETSLDRRRAGDFTARPGQLATLEADDVLGLAQRGVLVDARNPERYSGEVEPVDPVAGHIPGAVNVPTGANLRDDGTFKSAEELREVYAEARGHEVAAYCGSGVTAAHDLLAMAVAGIDGALYPGSWSEWVTDPERPVSTSGRP